VRPDPGARPEYIAAFGEIVARITLSLVDVPKRLLPVAMYVGGGAALYLYTGERVSRDIDAAFSRRIALPENLEVAYRDADGGARVLYLDRQYNDTLGLLHDDAYEDAVPLVHDAIDHSVLDVRLLSAVDLAVSKLARFSSQDADDIALLARRGLVRATALRRRAAEALTGYVGDVARLRGSIEIAGRIVEDAEQVSSKRR